MTDQIVKATERAIEKVVADFQRGDDRWWNERDVHWSLYYHLRQEAAVTENDVTKLIRAEFPTRKKFGDKVPARGHCDLVILDPDSYNNEPVHSMKAQTSWDKYLPEQSISVAIETKLWLGRLPFDRAQWDIDKLTEPHNNVQDAYFLNFVRLNFCKPAMKDYYRSLVDFLADRKRQWPELKILCVPSDPKMQIGPGLGWI